MNQKLSDEDKQREIDDFFAQFDNVSGEFDKISESLSTGDTAQNIEIPQEDPEEAAPESETATEAAPAISASRKSRAQRQAEKRGNNGDNSNVSNFVNKAKTSAAEAVDAATAAVSGAVNGIKNKFIIDKAGENPTMAGSKKNKTRSKRYQLNTRKLIKAIAFAVCGLAAIGFIFVMSIVISSPKIEPNNIYGMLSESSVLYDDQGIPIESIFEEEGKRTNVEYSAMPENLINAFVALEDKTFWTHNGFNFVRIFGAIKDSFTTGQISGTSTITQQLARNVYLAETKSERSLTRKIREAYYTIQLENNLTKEQIMEAYLNTIFLGYNSYGVQAASQAYFGKNVGDLDLLECAALAALPQAPDRYALIKTLENEAVTEDTQGILYKGSQFTYVFSDASKDRRDLCLKMMLKQSKINQEQYDAVMADTLVAHMNPGLSEKQELSSYFTDYVIQQVISDLQDEFDLEYSEAKQMLYTNGLSVYTTMDSDMQLIVEEEFNNNANFPSVANLKKDASGNILDENKRVLMYSYGNYFDTEGYFTLMPDEYTGNSDGSVTIFKGKRLNIYNTTVKGVTDYSLEFKPVYFYENSIFYCIDGGYINIPAEYKTRDDNDNLVISAKFFADYPDFFRFNETGMAIGPSSYTLNQKVVQPQSAMVITDYANGYIKAMVGGRNTKGRMLYNRAISPRQPGSSIKPMAVYSAALQQGYEAQAAGTTQTFVTYDNNGNKIPNGYGDYWTAASVIDDSLLKINGEVWPKNWYSGYRGKMTLRTAVEQSVNVCAVKVITQVGFDYSANQLEKMGVTTLERKDPKVNDLNAAALGLGGMTRGVSPLQMVGGYGCIANGGEYVEPISYTKVTNKRGEVLVEKIPKTEQVLNEGVAWIMGDILRTVVTNGIGKRASIPNQPVSGKTGTTTDNYDAWFVGYTPTYAASLWIGNDVNIELSQGSASAAKLWSKIMTRCLAGTKTESYDPPPANVVNYKGEYFIKGTETTAKLDNYVTVAVCQDTGWLATPWCENVIYKTGTNNGSVPGEGSTNREVPHYYCPYHNYDFEHYPIDPSGSGQYNFEDVPTESAPIPTPPAVVPTEPSVTPDPGTTPPTQNDGNNGNGNGNGGGEDKPGWI